MNEKWKKIAPILAILITLFSIGGTVMADDHHDDDDDEKQEYYQESGDHDDDDDDWGAPRNQITTEQQTQYWHIWSRKPWNNPTNRLPIAQPAELAVIVGGTESSLYFVPEEGQLLVSADAIAEVLAADAKFYPQNKITILTKGHLQLIVKAGSNAAFENKVKTPMPIQAAFYEKSIYLPVSVAANALGYRVSWDPAKETLIFQLF